MKMKNEIQRKKFENALLTMLMVNIAVLVILICYC